MPSASDGTSGRPLKPGVAGQPQHGPRADALLQIGGRGVVRLEQRRAQRHRVGLLAVSLRGLHSGLSGAVTCRRFVSTETGE